MQVEIIRSGSVVAGPMAFDAEQVRDIIMRQGGDYRLIPNGVVAAVHVGSISVLPVRYDKPDLSRTQELGSRTREVVGDEVVYTYEAVERDPDDLLEEAKEQAIDRVNSGYEQELSSIIDQYPDVETKTWDKQESEARAWLADNSVETPLLDGLAQGRQMDMAELVDRMIVKADAWVQLSGAATGKRQRLEDEIEAATTIQVADAVQWDEPGA